MRFLAIAAVLLLAGCSTAAVEEPTPTSIASEATSAQETEEAEASEEQPVAEESQASSDDQGESTEPQESEPETTATATTATKEPEPVSSEEEEVEQTQEPEPAPEPTIVGYTLAEVASRNSQAECWVAIDGGVYDLTMWIRSHPGGSGAILQLCGTDGTSMFLGQHGGQARPASTLDGYYIGPLR